MILFLVEFIKSALKNNIKDIKHKFKIFFCRYARTANGIRSFYSVRYNTRPRPGRAEGRWKKLGPGRRPVERSRPGALQKIVIINNTKVQYNSIHPISGLIFSE
jgi:hypothetical protein